jgi:multiple sugar transport system permease protein
VYAVACPRHLCGELEDAAQIDGASTWQRFRYVIWPLMRPTSFFVVVNSTTFNNMGYAAALTTVVVAILVACTGLMFAFTKGGRFDED